MYTDRLGSVGKYFPYGEERPSATGGDVEKFATYFRDGATGLDYAVNRYYDSGTGRFLTADPYRASAAVADPQSWNRYSYTGSDPVNYFDPAGLERLFPMSYDGPDGYTGNGYPDQQWYASGGMFSCQEGSGGPVCFQLLLPISTQAGTAIGGGGGSGSGAIQIAKDATYRSSDRISREKCAELFLPADENTPENRRRLAEALVQLADDNTVPVLPSSAATNIKPDVPAFTTGTNGLIYFIEDRSFFTGIFNSKPLGGAFANLSLSGVQELMVIHEFMHYRGIVGPDDTNQTYTLPNGKTVRGSGGISAAIRENCFN